MTISPETRRKNVWLLLGLIAFALALTLTVLLWMRVKIRENGGVVDPSYSMRLEPSPQTALPRFAALSSALAEGIPQL